MGLFDRLRPHHQPLPAEPTAEGSREAAFGLSSEWRCGSLVVVAFLGCMIAWGFIHSRLLRWL